jgi:hypothetical protein
MQKAIVNEIHRPGSGYGAGAGAKAV